MVRKEEDEVLFAIAEELGKIYTFLENKLVLLPLLEALCSTDETVVREQGVKSLFKIADALSGNDIQNIFAPMVNYKYEVDIGNTSFQCRIVTF